MPVLSKPLNSAKKGRVRYEPPAQSRTEEPAKNNAPPVEYIHSPKQISPSGRCVIFFKSVTGYEVMVHHGEGFKVYCMSGAVTEEETVAYFNGLEQRIESMGKYLYLRFTKSGEQIKEEDDTAATAQKKSSIRDEKDWAKQKTVSTKYDETNSEDDFDDFERMVIASFYSSLPVAPPGFPMQSKGKKSHPARRFPKQTKSAVVPSVEDNPAGPAC